MPAMARSTDPDVRLLTALADPVRLSIVRQLATCDGICACDFTDVATISQPTVSHHLKVLREAGVVTSERRGSWIWYRLAPDAVARLSTIARELIPGDVIPAGKLARPRSRPRLATTETEPLAGSATAD